MCHDEYEQALQLRPDYAIAHTNLGRIYEDLKEVDHATLSTSSCGDGAAAAIINLARLQILHGYSSKSVDLLLQGLKAQDPSVQSALHIGWVLLEQTRYAEAKAHLQEAIHLDPEMAAAHCLLGPGRPG